MTSSASLGFALLAASLGLLTFVANQLSSKRSASASYVAGLESRITRLETEVTTSRSRVVELEDENLRLMRKLLANGGTH